MESIYKRKNEDGSSVWRAVIRIKGHPSVSNHFERKQEAEDWVSNIELQTAMGHSSLQMLLRYTNLDTKNNKKFSDHISKKILKGSTI